MATIRSAVNVLGGFYEKNISNPEWQHFFQNNNIAMPICYLAYHDLAEPTSNATFYINETWNEFCSIFEADPAIDYDSLDEFLG